MATVKNSKGQVVAVAKQLIAGAEKHLTSTTQVSLLGSSLTPAQVTSTLQSLVTLRSDVDASKASTRARIANEATQMPALRAFMSAFESYVRAAFGSSPDVLADFDSPSMAAHAAHGRGQGGGRRSAALQRAPRGTRWERGRRRQSRATSQASL